MLLHPLVQSAVDIPNYRVTVPVCPSCEGVQCLATASRLSWALLHNDLSRLPLRPTFCDFSPFHYLFLSLLTFPACPYPIRGYVLSESSHAKLLHKVLFPPQKRVQSNGQRDVLEVLGDLLLSFWNTLRWWKAVIFQSNKHTIHELKLRIFLTVLFHNLHLYGSINLLSLLRYIWI